jgi:hypothetical protein
MPTYKTTLRDTIVRGANFHGAGQKLAYEHWPISAMALQPVDRDARVIDLFFRTFSKHPDLPPSPWNKALGRFFLPALCNIPDAPQPGMPLYVAEQEQRVGQKLIAAGEEIIDLGWPDIRLIRPANQPAFEVAHFYLQHAPEQLYVSPWCWFSESLVLASRDQRLGQVGPFSSPPAMLQRQPSAGSSNRERNPPGSLPKDQVISVL